MNQIRQIPDDIARLKNLTTFSLCANDLRSLPKELLDLKHLDTLDVSFNKNFTASEELNTLKQMYWLKYLNIVATNVDSANIETLRKSLPNTKIATKLDDIIDETFE